MQPFFTRRDGVLHAEDVPLNEAAARFGTPCYVYSKAAFSNHFLAYHDALADHPHLVCFALKSNSNLAVINLLAQLGAGFDIVSGGELERVLAAGGDPAKVVFSGVAKSEAELIRALQVGIKCFNVESLAELAALDRIAGSLGVQAPISIRVNPDVDAGTHPYISTGLKENKFGIAIDEALEAYLWANNAEHLNIVGVDCHIGSQLTDIAPFLDALDRVVALIESLDEHGIALHHLDLGGGLGVDYQGETPPSPQHYIAAIRQHLAQYPKVAALELILEPGRSIAANAGVLLTRVEFLKPTEERHFALVDAAMNDLIRPSLYGAWMRIERVDERDDGEPRQHARYDIVGPVCESGDFLGKDRELALAAHDLLAVGSAGAYSFTMASNYNTRPRPPEVMADGATLHLIREREPLAQLWAGEHVLPSSEGS
ncbi:diaminopimelate decarboxylase [Carnimonas nigrificans]|uniref:diaminopimelate decarboxylase n=1 Tax=Carnimonas nigrificans TaxID=64323 RepID=UPI000472CAD3|nr:diaminopimelate decarboxylase [Carnimonas nigrificans]